MVAKLIAYGVLSIAFGNSFTCDQDRYPLGTRPKGLGAKH